MAQLKKCKVVMLPTKEKAIIYTDRHGNLKKHNTPSTIPLDSIGSNFHLYILSDEPIKEGDWYLGVSNTLHQATSHGIASLASATPKVKKIIATTDELLFGSGEGLDYLPEHIPQPSQSFIKKYIERYNAGDPITHGMVEYHVGFDNIDNPVDFCILKVNPKDNTITIRSVKDTWSREEVVAVLYKRLEDSSTNSEPFNRMLKEQLAKWIEENL
jgi:hypothetical protein